MIFGPPKSTYFLGSFPLVPPLDNLRKWPILVTLLNWPELHTAGTFFCAKMFSDDCALNWLKLDTAGPFGAAVCAKMFSDDCALNVLR